jgi:hypothetical protein
LSLGPLLCAIAPVTIAADTIALTARVRSIIAS